MNDKNKMKPKPLIAVVDDDSSLRESTQLLLRSAGYRAEVFASAREFLGSPRIDETACLMLDVRMPGMDGLELQRRLNVSHADIPIIVVTAHDDATSRSTALDSGAIGFLSKPFQASTLVATVQTALTRRAQGTRQMLAPKGDG